LNNKLFSRVFVKLQSSIDQTLIEYGMFEQRFPHYLKEKEKKLFRAAYSRFVHWGQFHQRLLAAFACADFESVKNTV